MADCFVMKKVSGEMNKKLDGKRWKNIYFFGLEHKWVEWKAEAKNGNTFV